MPSRDERIKQTKWVAQGHLWKKQWNSCVRLRVTHRSSSFLLIKVTKNLTQRLITHANYVADYNAPVQSDQ